MRVQGLHNMCKHYVYLQDREGSISPETAKLIRDVQDEVRGQKHHVCQTHEVMHD